MNRPLDTAERWTRRTGLAVLAATLAAILWGVWRGTQKPVGRITGREPKVLRTRKFYILASVGYFSLCIRLWRPFSLVLSRPARIITLSLGSFLYFPGLALVLWGRLTLAQMYNVSSSFGAQLYADQQLVRHGPFSFVRHPMYLGIFLVGWGGLLFYRTWTFVLVLFHFPALLIRARREEQVLAAEFGEQWTTYSEHVPAWLPRLRYAPSINLGVT
jgi:protein-S-isoprenylcysteine O-methyltransferase Ste14